MSTVITLPQYDVVRSLEPSPAARIFFRGLLVLEPLLDGSKKICSVGVHKSADPHHSLRVSIMVVRPGTSVPHRATIVPFNLHDLTIEVSPSPGLGVRKFQYDDNPFNRQTADLDSHYDNDYRWIIDFADLHRTDSAVDRLNTHPGILLKDGVLHTAARTDNALLSVGLTAPGNPAPVNLYSIASIIGANIYFDSPSELVLTWNHSGEQRLPLAKLPPNSRYDIYIFNDPDDPDDHNEFKEYYKVLFKASTGRRFDPVTEQFDLISAPQTHSLGNFAKLNNRGSDRIPCMAVNNGGGPP